MTWWSLGDGLIFVSMRYLVASEAKLPAARFDHTGHLGDRSAMFGDDDLFTFGDAAESQRALVLASNVL
jgi:hypothetical protein